MSRHLNDLIASRRAFLGGLAGLPLINLAACATSPAPGAAHAARTVNFAPVAATNADTVTVPLGYNWRTLIAWGDPLFDTASAPLDLNALTRAEQELRFGVHNDMLALFAAEYAFPPPADQDRMLLCVNHEYASAELAFPALTQPQQFTPAHIESFLAAVGVSVVEIERAGGQWRVVTNSAPGQGHNRRITAFSPMRFTGPAANHAWIAAGAAGFNAAEPGAPGGAVSCGTQSNCAGGLTPWGTYLTAEENFDGSFAGAVDSLAAQRASDPAFDFDARSFAYPKPYLPEALAPQQFRVAQNPHGPALYGWIVEIDPYDPQSTPRKLTALGRKKNECATTALSPDGRVAVYMGDDQRDEFVYKFVSRRAFDPNNRAANFGLLDDGDLYAAQFLEDGGGVWLHLTPENANAAAAASDSPARFTDQGDVCVRGREAARLMGATPMDRPEDVEALRDENWRGLGPVLIVCTNNSTNGQARPGNPRRATDDPSAAQVNLTGHILRIDEAGGDVAATRFTWGVFAMAGDPNATALTAPTRDARQAHVSVAYQGEPTFAGDRFACPDNILIDSTHRVWITTDGNDGIFADCNDSVLATASAADATDGPRLVKRFLVGPVGGEICGPLMAPDEKAFFCCVQHPGSNDVAGADFDVARWEGAPVPSHFPDGGDNWPRSAVVIVTRDDGGRIGD